ncbi:MAG: hypothetical protein AAGD25_27435 [Cyanobacteria bacterium P01_F01_bin.150]
MKIAASQTFQLFKDLIHHELRHQQFVLPLSIQGAVKQDSLMIVLNYADVKTIDMRLDVQSIKRALSRFQDEYPQLSKQITVKQIQCYWRQKGEKKPYKGCSFHLPCEQAKVPENKRVGEPILTAKRVKKRAKKRVERSRSKVAPTTSGSPTVTNASDSNSIPISSTVPPLELQNAALRRWRLQNWRWGKLGIVLTAVLTAVGMGSYVWSRPCVSSECTILDEARALNASLAFEETASIKDVTNTYSTLLEINHQLSQVPFWSPDYEEVKDLLSTHEAHTHQVSQVLGAEEQAKVASAASQAPPYPLHDWQTAQQHWQTAIQTLEPVSSNAIVSPLAQTQLQEYQTKLQFVEQKMSQEQTALNYVKAARKFAQRAENHSSLAVSAEQLKHVEADLKNALEQLTGVSEETMAYAEAEHLRAIYEPLLADVRDRLSLETLAEDAYRQAIESAKQSVTFEQEDQWTLAVTHWQQSLDHISQVPENTAYHGQVMPLITSYTTALTNAQEHLQEAVTLQNAQDELAKRCDAVPSICKAVTFDTVLHVWLAADLRESDFVAEPAPSSSQGASGLKTVATSPDIQPQITAASSNLHEWLKDISSVGKTMQVSIQVYGPDGQMFGTYNPQTSSFVQIATASRTTATETITNTSVSAIAPEQL